ncbi:MAG TPA: hypothetical protein VGB28_08465 [Actinomycetota bacterium]|jgi:hypothetical protein
MEQEMKGSQAPPFGPVAAVLLAAGIGALVLGLLTTLAEASTALKDSLQLTDPVGPLSGKTVFATVAFFVAWGILHTVLRQKDPAPRGVYVWTSAMVGLGLLLTFPLFFELFTAE